VPVNYRVIEKLSDVQPIARSSSMSYTGIGREVGSYRIYEGRYSCSPELHAAELKNKGPLFVAVSGESIVAFAHKGLNWTDPEHRGCGLGAELLADSLQAHGPVAYYSNRKLRFTRSGIQLILATHRILVHRGVVRDG
jgi:hypothetical protein